MTSQDVRKWAFKSEKPQIIKILAQDAVNVTAVVRRDSGVVTGTPSDDEGPADSPSCDLADPRDISEVVDAMKKLLRLTDLTSQEQRGLLEDLWIASRALESPGKRLLDKSMITSLLLHKADSLKLPEQEADIKGIVLEVTNIFRL